MISMDVQGKKKPFSQESFITRRAGADGEGGDEGVTGEWWTESILVDAAVDGFAGGLSRWIVPERSSWCLGWQIIAASVLLPPLWLLHNETWRQSIISAAQQVNRSPWLVPTAKGQKVNPNWTQCLIRVPVENQQKRPDLKESKRSETCAPT